MSNTLIFKLKTDNVPATEVSLPEDFKITIWKPSLHSFIPPRKGKKYIIYWLFHIFRIFRNRDYCAFFIHKGQTQISSMLVVPAHFKWPFMQKNDVQFTYVMTSPDYRGQGIGKKMLQFALDRLKNTDRVFWYVTNTENIASEKLCSKVGFEQFSRGHKSGFINILRANPEN